MGRVVTYRSALAGKGGAIPEVKFDVRDFTAGYGLKREVAGWVGLIVVAQDCGAKR